MTFDDCKITAFQKRISDLPDQPNMSAAQLKACFDSSPEELRQAHNALCTETNRLNDRVSGIVAQTFTDTIDKEMLKEELIEEIEAKATESSVVERLQTKQEAIDTLATTVAQKCEAYIGYYRGDGQEYQDIELGFQPRGVLVCPHIGFDREIWEGGAQFASVDSDAYFLSITETGFRVKDSNKGLNNTSSLYSPYHYVAFK